jgi:hypothetical protein
MTTVVEHRARRNRGRVASPARPRWRLTSRWLALGAALIVFSGRISALDAGVAILVLIAAVAATATRLIQAARCESNLV